MQQNRSDFVWFLATRLGALAIAIAGVAVFVADNEHDNISESQAVAAHKAEMSSRMRKSPDPEAAAQR